jgi:hypothetical protein
MRRSVTTNKGGSGVGVIVGVEVGEVVGAGGAAVSVGVSVEVGVMGAVGTTAVSDVTSIAELSGWLTAVQPVRAKATTNNNKRRVSVAMFISYKRRRAIFKQPLNLLNEATGLTCEQFGCGPFFSEAYVVHFDCMRHVQSHIRFGAICLPPNRAVCLIGIL